VIAKRFLVSGRVQGVGFRAFVAGRAQEREVAGFTRNLPDGRVEVLAQGSERDVGEMESALRRGPALSRVDDLQVLPATPEAGRVGFQILY
jgi:acylphosphatase